MCIKSGTAVLRSFGVLYFRDDITECFEMQTFGLQVEMEYDAEGE